MTAPDYRNQSFPFGLLDNLQAVVQYRRKDNYSGRWLTMAAFDTEHQAVRYAKECSGEERHWEYRVVRLRNQTDVG